MAGTGEKIEDFDGNLKEWVNDLNLDPRNRAAASIGTQTVRKHQETFMEMAWQQIGDINEANQKIREAELAKMINNAIYEKHYAKMDDDKLLMVTAAAQKQIIIPNSNKTFEAELTATKIPNAARSAAFKKLIRPGKKNIKKMNEKGKDDLEVNRIPVQQSLMTNFNIEETGEEEKALTAARKKINPSMVITTGEVETAINYFLSFQEDPETQENENLQLDSEATTSQTQFLNSFNTFSTVINGLQIVSTPPPINSLVNFSQSLFQQINPMLTIPNLIFPLIMSGNNQIEEIKPIMAYPEIPDPMFFYLQNLSQDFIIPNIREIPENTITLLENNQIFIESFMAGLNHEMSKELLWREYPTDQRGSYFRNFWDDKDSLSEASDHDILAMDRWKGKLGIHNERIIHADGTAEQKKNFIVLVIRGDVLKKYPNTVIYAQKAVFKNGGTTRTLASSDLDNIKTPIFQAELEPDIAMYGFDLTKEEARGNTEFPAGWFFVMQERPGHINFGLDDSPEIPDSSAQQWNDLEWGHLVPENGSLDNLNHIHCNAIRSSSTILPKWGTNSAEMAYILYQMPVIFARHAEEMLP